MHRLQVLISFLLLLCAPAAALAQGRVVIDSDVKAQRGLYPIAVPMPQGDGEIAKMVQEVLEFDLSVSSWFKTLDPKSFIANLESEGLSIEPQKWKDVGAFAVVKARVEERGSRVKMQFKLYELDRGAVPVLSWSDERPKSEARAMVHVWANKVVEHFTGEPGFAGSEIVFVTRDSSRKRVVLKSDFDGSNLARVSNNRSENILPALSPDGKTVAYTSYMRRNPDLYVVPATGGRARQLASYPGMNTGAAFSPDGRSIAVTLSRDGNAEIYLIEPDTGRVKKRLTNNRYIDTSAAFSGDGREIAFVSDREGGPQIFVMKADGSGVRRVTTVGKHNQTPAWCPVPGKRVIAYTARDDASGHFDIVTLDLDSGQLTRITQNQGNNEEPTWSPNCRVIAFASSRDGASGIYLANADGTGKQRRIYRTWATAPDWGPVLVK